MADISYTLTQDEMQAIRNAFSIAKVLSDKARANDPEAALYIEWNEEIVVAKHIVNSCEMNM